jgi:NAD(P)H-flavin reductase
MYRPAIAKPQSITAHQEHRRLTGHRDYFVATGVLFTISWLYRHVRIYFEHGIRHRAELSRASNGFIRVDIPTTATWTPGQHYFIRFMILGLHAWTIHPFTVCSLPVQGTNDDKDQNKLVFFIRPQGGFTARLAKFVESSPNATARVLLDGPYGGVMPEAITDSQRMLVIAGGSGAGWAFPLIKAFLKRLPKEESDMSKGTQPSLKVVLATREFSTGEWFEKEMQEMLASQSIIDTAALKVEIYYTGSQAKEASIASERPATTQNDPEKALEAEPSRAKPTVNLDVSEGLPREGQGIQHLNSRPDLAAIVAKESGSMCQSQNMSVFVCGPLGMQNDVSNAVAGEQLSVAKRGSGDIYLHLEHFSWA